MKSIKKLSVLVALILCVTVGGVYAAWTYAADAGLTETVNKAVTIAPVSQAGSIGQYEVGYTEFSLVIDQTSNSIPVNYTPKLVIRTETDDGSLNFKFTPSTVASDEVRVNGVESHVEFTSNLTHDGQAIFSFPLTIDIATADNDTAPIKWIAQADGSFTCEIPHTELENYIKLAYTDKLDTYAKYQAFESSLGKGTINIKIYNNYANS